MRIFPIALLLGFLAAVPALADTITFDVATPADIAALEARVAALEAGGGGTAAPVSGGALAGQAETTTALISSLYVQNNAPYETAYCLTVPGPVMTGETFMVYGEAHGNPQQADQVELAWVTGIYVGTSCDHGNGSDVIYTAARAMGRDMEKHRKGTDNRIGSFTTTQDHPDGFTIRYIMRGINLNPGGYFELSTTYGKLGYLRFAPATQ